MPETKTIPVIKDFKKFFLLLKIKPSWDILSLGLGSLAFSLWMITLHLKYLHFGFYDWDFALFSHATWNIAHGSLYNSLMGINYLGNHANYIAIILSPLYALAPHPMTLLTLKVFAYTTGAFFVYGIAKKTLSIPQALVLMFIYLIFPPNVFSMLFEFDFENLAMGLLFALFYFFQEKKLWPFLITALLVCALKENMPLVVAAFGVFALFTKRKNKLAWGIVPLALGGGIFTFSVFWFIPHLRAHLASPLPYIGLYHSLGPDMPSVVTNAFAYPLKILRAVFFPPNLDLFVDMAGPLWLLAICSPHILFLGLPLILQNFLSAAATQHTIFYHYAASIIPFIFLATLNTLTFLRKRMRRGTYALAIGIILIASLFNTWQYRALFAQRINAWADPLDSTRQAMVQLIPPRSGVISTFAFLPELSMRKELYSFHNLWRGHNQITGESPFVIPDSVRYALIDFHDPWLRGEALDDPQSKTKRIFDFLRDGNWSVLAAQENIVLFQKKKFQENPILTVEHTQLPLTNNIRGLIIDDRFALKFIQKGKIMPGEFLQFAFHWLALENIPDHYMVGISIRLEGRDVVWKPHDIGYLIYPTTQWQKGNKIMERYWLTLPKLKPGNYTLEIIFYNLSQQQNASFRETNSSNPKNVLVLEKFQVE